MQVGIYNIACMMPQTNIYVRSGINIESIGKLFIELKT